MSFEIITFLKQKKKILILFLVILLASTLAFLLIKDVNVLCDELTHYYQIRAFANGNFRQLPALTTIPGYHLFFAYLSKPFGQLSIPLTRFLSMIFSLLSVLLFFFISKNINPDSNLTRTMQYYFFPILFPFFFLIYTDVFSIFLILLSLYLVFKQRFYLSAIAGILSIFVRQNNVIWLFLILLLIYHHNYKFSISFSGLKIFLKHCWLYILGIIGFFIFVILNKGFAVGDVSHHPAFSFHLGNVFFMLFLFFFLFLPLNIANFNKIIGFIKQRKKILFLIIPFFIIYIFTFVIDHEYNHIEGFLRNFILLFFTSNFYLKVVFFIVVTYSILSLSVTKLYQKSLYLLYPLTFLYLIPSWLIEQRYYLIPFTLFMLFREKKSNLVEYSSIIIYIIFSAIFFWAIANRYFFL